MTCWRDWIATVCARMSMMESERWALTPNSPQSRTTIDRAPRRLATSVDTFDTRPPSTSRRPSRSIQGKIPGIADEASSALFRSPLSISTREPVSKSVAIATNGMGSSSMVDTGSRVARYSARLAES